MKTSEIIVLLRNLINSLQAERDVAFGAGNVQRVLELNIRIEETRTTLEQLEALQSE